ncbi:MAG TPA: DUF3828 domain-containing protein [Pyrinomonadaceae bacterium]|jgi:hypothetical protein
MNKKIIKSILLLTILISTFNCASASRTETANNAANTATSEPDAKLETTETTAADVGGAAEKTAPDALVKDLYKTHDKDNGAILDGKSRRLLDKYFDKTLADFIWKDLTTHKDEVGVLDFDPFYNAQDIRIKNFNVGAPKVEGDKASVPVTFQNFDRKETLNYALRRQTGAWKISDIKYTNGESLVGYFKEDAKKNAANESGNFEGTYKVGATTCTVKPVKMAYEIKWAKGSGTMLFFTGDDVVAGANIFVSEDTGKGRDKFIFDDDNFATGKFVRADGKEMPVSRVK